MYISILFVLSVYFVHFSIVLRLLLFLDLNIFIILPFIVYIAFISVSHLSFVMPEVLAFCFLDFCSLFFAFLCRQIYEFIHIFHYSVHKSNLSLDSFLHFRFDAKFT